MPRFVLFLIAVALNTVVFAQASSEEKAIKKTIEAFFNGLHKGDSTLMKSTLYTDVKIQTTSTNREGKRILKTDSKKQLLTQVANKNPAHIYFEKINSYHIKIDGNLASVWTPYEFYFNNQFSHCGANSFQLFNTNGKWKIIYLVDTRRRQNCNPKIDKK